MSCLKGLHRSLAWLLLCCIAVGLVVTPALAVNATPLENEQSVPEGRLVSLVRYSGYNGSLVIGCLDNGTELTVLGEKGSFYKIDCYDMKGYIAKSQVTVGEDGKYYVYSIAGSPETKVLPNFSAEQVLNLRSTVKSAGLSMLGTPYLYGGTTSKGIDCSAFTGRSYSKAGISLLRTAQDQLANGVVVAKEDMQIGDLIFFKKTMSNNRLATHVGIYIGNGKMVHSGSRGVEVADLSIDYWINHYLCARRVILTDTTTYEQLLPVEITQDINSSYWRENSQTQVEAGDFSFKRLEKFQLSCKIETL